MNEMSPEDVTAFDIRVRLDNFATLLSTSIENSADQIIAGTSDPVVKENALLWKMNAIPAGFTALFFSDPLAAGLDTWAFTVQMDNFFKRGNGKGIFKEHQGIAVQTCSMLEQYFEDFIMEFNNDTLDLRQKRDKILEFSQNNPITDLSFYRRSIIPKLGSILSKKDLSLVQSLGTLEQNLDDLRTSLNIYSAYLPKQARWQAEYVVQQTLAEISVDTVVRDFSSIAKAIERLTPIIEQKIFYEINRQREESFKFVQNERREVFLELDRERQLVFQDLKDLIREEIHDERVQAFIDLEPVIERIIEKSIERMESPIDHFFIRLIEYTILLGIAIVILLILKPRLFRQSKS
jgi:hypothetical protein